MLNISKDKDLAVPSTFKPVLGIALHAKYEFAPYVFLIEYVGALESFRENQLAFNSEGAKPRAFDVEVAYKFNLGKRKFLRSKL